SVDPVVEQQDRDVDVAAQGVDEVVAADRERIAVAGDDPHREVLAGGGQAGGDGRGAPVDGVHPVGVEVVREAAGAADAGDEDDVLPAQAEVGQERLHGLEYGVVTAPGAPADLLVGGEVLAREQLVLAAGGDTGGAVDGEGQGLAGRLGGHHASWVVSREVTRSVMTSSSWAAFSGMPLTWL